MPTFARAIPTVALSSRLCRAGICRHHHSRGVAVVIALFAVALVSIVVLVFFNLAMLNRSISFSSAGQARANLLALTALNLVKGDCIAEIQSGSSQEVDSTGANTPIYLPSTNTTMTPYRMTAAFTNSTGQLTNAAIPASLVKWSSGTLPLWPTASAYAQAGPIRATTNLSTDGNLSGHFIANVRWTKPLFNTNTTFPTTVVPQWVLMTRSGPTNGAGLTLGSGANTLNNASSANGNYVIGRFAYTVYDEGGMLDVAAAGYSPSTMGSSPTDVGRKGSQGFADLTQLGLTLAQADTFVNWRNSYSGTSLAGYVGYLTTNAPASGFLKAATSASGGDQAFLSRQDLIQYWTSPSEFNLTTVAGTNMLGYLTTFSREKNAPSWGPEHDANDPNLAKYWNGTNADSSFDSVTWNDPSGGISYAYRTKQDTASANNRFMPNVRVKTVFTRLSQEQAVVGEPLVKNRFDLSKLAWITYNGTLPTGVSMQDIYNYFGLIPNYSSTTGALVSWTYNHTSHTAPASGTDTSPAADTDHIMTLDEVASLPAAKVRDPDYFELLQAAILRGSLGLVSGDPSQASVDSNTATGGEFYRAAISTMTNAVNEGGALYRPMNSDTSAILHVVHAQPMYQIIQIGANIIDQTDTDNFPTEIILDGDHFYGIENLPYISGIGDAALRVADKSPPTAAAPYAMTYDVTSTTDTTISGSTTYQQYVHRWLDFALWNPHQNAQYPPSVTPAKFRISVMCGAAGAGEYPSIEKLGSTSPVGGTDFSGRKFEVPGSSVTVPSAGNPAYADGPAWIGFKLSDYPNNFSEPTAIDYTHSYTSDTDNAANTGALNINDPNGRIQTAPGGSAASGWSRAGIYLGWSKSPDNPYKVPACVGVWPNYLTSTAGSVPSLTANPNRHALINISMPGLTFYLQYEDVSHPGVWHTYQELHNLYYSRGQGVGDAYMEPNDTSWSSWTRVPTNPEAPTGNTTNVAQFVYPTATASYNGTMLTNMDTATVGLMDPRSMRNNMGNWHNSIGWGATGGSGTDLMTTSTFATISEPAKGFSAGVHFSDFHFQKTWVDNISISPAKNWDYSGTSTYYTDRDSIPRVGDAAGWTNVVLPADASASSPRGASPLTPGAMMQRPLHLDRPFRSVAELGYVFRDDPWKTLNLFTANSGDSALLDVFYIGSSSTSTPTAPAPDVVAGKMNINSAALNAIAVGGTPAKSPVMQALISQMLRDYKTPSGTPAIFDSGITVSTDIVNAATNVVNYIKVNGPLQNMADLPGVFPQVPTSSIPTPIYTGLKNPSEALVRGLADSSGTRTWNLMIDIVAQAGKYSPAAANLSSFTVEGEKHYWLHVAIDRFTGEIVDQQLEPVWE